MTSSSAPSEAAPSDISSRLARALPASFALRMNRWAPVLGVGFLLCVPLVAFVAWHRAHDHWAPIFDVAMLEMHVRDVGTAHTPLIGLGGRLGADGNASHPGPVAFYLLAPVYRLLGGTYWALRASMAVMNAVAIIASLVIANRRSGRSAVLAVGVWLGLLEVGDGLMTLTEPFNPHLPVFWFGPFLVAAWSVVDEDRRLFPILVAIACICAQIHVSYLPLCGAIGLYAFFFFARSWHRAANRAESREHLRLFITSVAIAVVLWLPPIIEQLTRSPGNLTTVVDYFAHPPEREQSLGLWNGIQTSVANLDLAYLAYGLSSPGVFREWIDPWPQATHGAPVLAVWALVALATWKRVPELRRLHVLLLVSFLVFVVAVSRILGFPMPYLLFPGWAIGMGILVVTMAAVLVACTRTWQAPRVARGTSLVALAVLLGCMARLAVTAPEAIPPDPARAAQLALLAPKVAEGLRLRRGAATGESGRYFIKSSSAMPYDGQVFGLLNELERSGFSVIMQPPFGWNIGKHRIGDEKEATATLYLVTGGFVDDVGRSPEATLLAYVDSRTPEARADYELVRSVVVSDLRRLGHAAVADRIDWDLGAAEQVRGLDEFSRIALGKMVEIGIPAAVYVEPIRPP